MLYRIYIYNPNAEHVEWFIFSEINNAIRSPYANDIIHSYMIKPFDSAKVKDEIEEKIGDKCKVTVCFAEEDGTRLDWLSVVTTYDAAEMILPQLLMITETNRLALFDAERQQTLFKTAVGSNLIHMKKRIQVFKEAIVKDVTPVWSIHRLFLFRDEPLASYSAFVVTLSKEKDISFLDRTAQFYECLKAHLADGETIYDFGDQSFTVKGENYFISFCLEGYKKEPNMAGYIEDGQPRMKLLNRMGCEKAYKLLKNADRSEKNDQSARMKLKELVYKIQNPADRYVYSVNLMKWLRTLPYEVDYTKYTGYTHEFGGLLFNVAQSDHTDHEDRMSSLGLGKDVVSFVLPFVREVYPFYRSDGMCEHNYMPLQTAKQIIARLSEIEKLVKEDPFSNELKAYLGQFDFSVFKKTDDDDRIIETNPAAFLADHRYEIATVYRIVIEWADLQFEYSSDESIFNIKST